jgi:uncharacterized protein (TIGR02147 family)
MAIWDFGHYREYLESQLGGAGHRTGARKKLAAHIPVHTTFVSQVLKGKADFSLEQAEAINQFLGHTNEESEYFIYLVLKDRAASQNLRRRFEAKISAMRKQRLNIKRRLDPTESVSDQDRIKFYSNHYYAAVHVLASIPNFRNTERMAEALKLSRERAQDIVDFLLKIGLLVEKSGELLPGPRHVHLNADSEIVLKHHSNWRLHAISDLQFMEPEDVHYSACMSLSLEDAHGIKEAILQGLKANLDVVTKSKDEVAYVMAFDFYKLLK